MLPACPAGGAGLRPKPYVLHVFRWRICQEKKGLKQSFRALLGSPSFGLGTLLYLLSTPREGKVEVPENLILLLGVG